jgi:hypothetical protein
MNLQKFQKKAIVDAIMADVPPIDKAARAKAIKEAIVKAMSPEVRKLYKTKPEALRAKTVEYTSEYRYYGDEIPVGDVTNDQLNEILKPYHQQEEERRLMRGKLQGAFEGVRTIKAALKMFPEFEKYYPTEAQPTKNLPALANVAADLSKLGWPKK